jgi:hypothetical protein
MGKPSRESEGLLFDHSLPYLRTAKFPLFGRGDTQGARLKWILGLGRCFGWEQF